MEKTDKFVTWGDQTWQEMAVAFFDIAHPLDQPRVVARPKEDPAAVALRNRRIQKDTDLFLSQLDRNGDGVVVPAETPDAFRKFGFRRMDQDGDGRLVRSEIEAEVARRF